MNAAPTNRRNPNPLGLRSLRVLAADIGFTEGPVWTGEEIVVTSITRGELYAMTLAGGDAAPVAVMGGGPNGLAHDPATGQVWVAQNGRVHMPVRPSVPARAPGIQSWHPERGVVRHHTDPDSAPNDCVIGPDGLLWFTSPAGDPHEGTARVGSVRTLAPATGEVTTRWRTDGYPNGLAFGPRPDQLYVAETRRGRIVELRVDPGGTLEPVRSARLERGYPDGLAVSADGHLLVAGTSSGTLEVLAPDLTTLGSVDLGAASMPTNVCFAGPDLDHVVVTLAKGGRVVGLSCDTVGLAPTAAPIPSTTAEVRG